MKNTAKKVERRDYNKGQKDKAQEGFLVNIVKDWWEIRDPFGKLELYGELGDRYDCSEGADFYNNYPNTME